MPLQDSGPPLQTASPPRGPGDRAKVARDARVAEALRLATTEFELAACRRRLRASRAVSLVLGILLALCLIALLLAR